MAKVLFYRSTTASAIPVAANVAAGQLAMNLADERLFMKNAAGSIVEPQPRAHTHPASQITGIFNSAAIPSGADLNGYQTPGIYHQNTDAGAQAGTNYPLGEAGLLQVFTGQSGNFVYQIYYTARSASAANRMFWRAYYASGSPQWNGWSESGSGAASQVAVTTVDWCASRAGIPAGYVPGDGQTGSRALYPDVLAAIQAGTVPVVSDADWLADPSKRGAYTLGDGSTTIRFPDYNGKSSGTYGAAVLRGDGTLSAGTNGIIQRDSLQGHVFGFTGTPLGAYGIAANAQNPGGLSIAAMRADVTAVAGMRNDGTNGDPRVASETRMLNVTGCFIIKAFGGVVNPGSADVSQLTTDYAVLSNSIDFMHYYANGSEAAPATIIANTRYVFANPFPGYEVLVDVQIKPSDGSGAWFYPGWASTYVSTAWQSHGVSVSQLSTGQIICQTGTLNVAAAASIGGGGAGEISTMSTALVRLRVWKVRGLL